MYTSCVIFAYVYFEFYHLVVTLMVCFKAYFLLRIIKYSLFYLIVLTKSQKEKMKCCSGHLLKNLSKTSHCAHILIYLVQQLKIGQLLANTTLCSQT